MQANIFTKLKEIIRKLFCRKSVDVTFTDTIQEEKLTDDYDEIDKTTDKTDDIVASAFLKVPDYVIKKYRTRGS